MSLILSPRAIGQGWERIPLDAPATALSQYMRLDETKAWIPMPISLVGYPCRQANIWRRPVTRKAKWEAIWAAKGNLFKRYILRKTS